MTLEGLWSKHMHPKEFPENGWLTGFTDLIGASHSSDYYFWEYGKFASEGLRQVAESGSTHELEKEIMDKVTGINPEYSICLLLLFLKLPVKYHFNFKHKNAL
jgi:hypothetical protein